jgi:hypothetical protein
MIRRPTGVEPVKDHVDVRVGVRTSPTAASDDVMMFTTPAGKSVSAAITSPNDGEGRVWVRLEHDSAACRSAGQLGQRQLHREVVGDES